MPSDWPRLRPLAVATGVLALALLVAGAIGCSAPTRCDSLVTHWAGSQPDAQMEFWHRMARQRLTSNDDAMHAILLWLDGRDDAASYAQRVERLHQRHMLPGGFAGGADEALERGTLAVAMVEALKLPRGLNAMLLRGSPRYAIRELEFRGLLPPSSPQQLVKGSELLGLLGRAQDVRRGNPADLPAAALPGENLADGPATPDADSLAADTLPPAWVPDPDLLTLQPVVSHPLLLSLEAMAQDRRPPLPDGLLEIVVTGVEGTVQWRPDESAAWQPAKVGQVVREGAEFRTGLPGAVRCLVRPNQVASLDRLGTMRFLRARMEDRRAVLDVGMEYGRTRVDVEKTRLAWPVHHLADAPLAAGPATAPTTGPAASQPSSQPATRSTTQPSTAPGDYEMETVEFRSVTTIASPSGRLAVGGTRVSLLDQRPFLPEATSLTGTATFTNVRRQLVVFGAAGRSSRVRGDNASAAELSLEKSIVDPTLAGARTAPEQLLLDDLVSRGAVIALDDATGFRIVRGGVPPTDAQLQRVLPGDLNFALRWQGNTNLDLAVGSPPTAKNPWGDLVYPIAGLDIASSGGRTTFDHQGGSNGGIEVAFWPAGFPEGIYALSAYNAGKQPASARFDAYLSGQKLDPIPGFETQRDVEPGASAIVLYQVDRPVILQSRRSVRRIGTPAAKSLATPIAAPRPATATRK